MPASRIVRRAAVDPGTRRAGRTFFGWGTTGLSRAERERAIERLAIFALSGVLAFAVLVFGGALLWDQVIQGQRTVLRVDGQTTNLRQFAGLRSYKENVLLGELQQAQQLASQPPPAGADPSSNFLQQYAQQQVSQIQNQLSGVNDQVIEDLIDSKLIREEAAKRKITVTPDEVNKELQQIVGYQDPNATPVPAATPSAANAAATAGDAPATPEAPSVAAATAEATPAATPSAPNPTQSFQSLYKNYLRATAGSDALVRQDVENTVLRRKLNDDLAKTIPDTAEQIHARHILVPDETAANAVLERLKNGESFEALAAELSTDTSNKDKGGDLGWFPHGVMVSAFEDAAFKLQPGQTSGPVKTDFGVHIIRVDERDPNRPLDPSQLESLKNGALTKWLDAEKQSHKIERFMDSSKLDWAYRHGPQPRAIS